MDNQQNTFALFEGRHELPAHSGALFSDFDFDQFRGEATEHYDTAIATIDAGGRIDVIVTGLTPALAQFIAHAFRVRAESARGAHSTLNLYHFDRNSGGYRSQAIF